MPPGIPPPQQRQQPKLLSSRGLSFHSGGGEDSPADLWLMSLTRPCPWPPPAASEAGTERSPLLVSTLGDGRRAGLGIPAEAAASGAGSARSACARSPGSAVSRPPSVRPSVHSSLFPADLPVGGRRRPCPVLEASEPGGEARRPGGPLGEGCGRGRFPPAQEGGRGVGARRQVAGRGGQSRRASGQRVGGGAARR